MEPSVYDLKAFYNSRTGRVVRRILQERIKTLWSDTKDLRVMGCGYAAPYLRVLGENAERSFSIMPAGQGAHHWPQTGDEKNRVCLAEQSEIPVETNSIDRVIMVHDLEYCEFLQPNLAEIWRVLKSNGRLLVIAPNRTGLWARADWSPFGQGKPFSVGQLTRLLHDNKFTHEQTEEALFMPPLQYAPILKMAGLFERIGQSAFPIVAGVHIVEASKQLYARADKGHGARNRSKGRGMLVPKPVVQRTKT